MLGKNHYLITVLAEKKKHQILEYACFSKFNIITHTCDIIKRITGNDERTTQWRILYDDFKATGNSVNSFNYIWNKSFNIVCSGWKFHYLTKNLWNKSKPLESTYQQDFWFGLNNFTFLKEIAFKTTKEINTANFIDKCHQLGKEHIKINAPNQKSCW